MGAMGAMRAMRAMRVMRVMGRLTSERPNELVRPDSWPFAASPAQVWLPFQGQQLDLTWQSASKKLPSILHEKLI